MHSRNRIHKMHEGLGGLACDSAYIYECTFDAQARPPRPSFILWMRFKGAFKGKGCMKPIKIVEREPLYIQCISEIGNAGSASIRSFTSWPGSHQLKKIRLFKIKKTSKGKEANAMMNVDFRTWPPWKKTLRAYGGQTISWQYGNVPNPDIPTIVMSISGHFKMRFWNLSGRWWFSPHSNERYTRGCIMCHKTGWRLRRGNGGFDEYGNRWGWNTLD